MEDPSQPPLEREQQPDVACPHCALPASKVKTVGTEKGKPGLVTITMACNDCGQTWMVKKLTHQDAPA
ncbi:MAG TPA: hypothetical protein VFZ31_11525 [Vicinamibacterales bacterium]